MSNLSIPKRICDAAKTTELMHIIGKGPAVQKKIRRRAGLKVDDKGYFRPHTSGSG